MHAVSRPAGIVLAGGHSSRLGVAAPAGGKAWLELDGRTFLERVVAAVGPEVDDLVIVAAAGQPLPEVRAGRVVRDGTPAAGPLAAVADGLRALAAAAEPPAAVVVASCDLPLLRPGVVALLVARCLGSAAVWTVPLVAGHPQVLLSVARPALLPRIEAWIAAGRRDLRGLLARLAEEDPATIDLVPEEVCRAVDPRLESFRDIDTPADVARLRGREGG